MADNIEAVGLEFDTREYERAIRRAERRLDDLEDSVDRSTRSARRQETQFLRNAGAVISLVGAWKGLDIMRDTGRFIFNTNRGFEVLEARLTAITGSAERSERAFDMITDFARNTPFEVQNLVDAFTILQAAGLEPTQEQLEGVGNFAAAMGRDITDAVEAIVRASQGGTERLRESFFVPIKKENDELVISFRGQTERVRADSLELVNHFAEIGNTEFADGMERRMSIIDGSLSNLSDTASLVARDFGEDTGFNSELARSISLLDEAIASSDGLAISLGTELARALKTVNDLLDDGMIGELVQGAGMGIGIGLDQAIPGPGNFFARIFGGARSIDRDRTSGPPTDLPSDAPPQPPTEDPIDTEALEARMKAYDRSVRAAQRLLDTQARMNSSLEEERIRLVEGEEAAFRFSLAIQGITGATQDALVEKWQLIEALEAQRAAAEQLAEQELAKLEAEYEQLKLSADRMAESVVDSFTFVGDEAFNLLDRIGQAVDGIIAELTRLAIRRTITEPLQDAFLGALGGESPVGTAPGAIKHTIDPITNLPVAGMVVVNATQNLSLSAIDSKTGAEFIRSQKGEIMGQFVEGIQQSDVLRKMTRA